MHPDGIEVEINLQRYPESAEVSELVKAIKRCEQESASFKRRLNTHGPTSRLMEEVWAEIFYQLVLKEYELYWTGGNWSGPFTELFRVMQVCTSWRNVALQHPRLWSLVTFAENCSLSNLVHILFVRPHVKNAKVSLQAKFTNSQPQFGTLWLLTQTVDYLKRATWARLSYMGRPFDYRLHQLSPDHSAASLTSLEFHYCGLNVPTFLNFDESRESLLNYLEVLKMPCLTTLKLVRPSYHVFRALSRETITSLSIDFGSRPLIHPVSLTFVLSRFPSLERLSVHVPQTKPSNDLNPLLGNPLVLSRLLSLTLRAPAYLCANILGTISLRPTAEVSLFLLSPCTDASDHGQEGHRQEGHLQRIATRLREMGMAWFGRPLSLHVRQEKLKDGNTVYTIRIRSNETIFEGLEKRVNESRHNAMLTLQTNLGHYSGQEYLKAIFASLPLDFVRTAEFEQPRSSWTSHVVWTMAPAFWRSCLSRMTYVTRLLYSGSKVTGLLQVLGGGIENFGRTLALCPQLKCFELVHVFDDKEEIKLITEMLQSLAAHRLRLGSPIAELMLKDVNSGVIPPDELRGLLYRL